MSAQFAPGDTVSILQSGSNRRILARIEAIDGDTVKVIFLSGKRVGMKGYALLSGCKKPRTSRNRKEYAFGGRIINQNQEG